MTTRQQLLLTLTIAFGLTGCGGSNPTNQSGTDVAAPGVPNEPSPPATPPPPPITSEEYELIDAAVKGDNTRITKLLAAGINVDVKDSNGGTPLGHAAWFGHVETVKLLIEKGADVNAKKLDGATPVALATYNKHPEVVEILKKAGAK
jgi:ankyrin repeat protein